MMVNKNNPFETRKPFRDGHLYSLPALEKAGVGPISRLPVSLRVVLESLLRNCDGERVKEEQMRALANWDAAKPAKEEIPFVVARIILQDFTGVPLLVDLAAMRSAVERLDMDPAVIEPLVPVDLVVDHSVQVDRTRIPTAFLENLEFEFERNRERYEFLKWGQQAFDTFQVVPPGIGIVHQVNLEYLAKVVFSADGGDGRMYYPDTLVGTDSHTTMINGLGIVGWGVGGIEAEAGMLGQPIAFQTPEVIGVHLTGTLAEGVTATDLTLRITEMLRREKVVGKFVEFFGEGASVLSIADRATIANMSPEYGATMGFFPIDERTLEYLEMTGRSRDQIDLVRSYYEEQGMFGIPREGDVDYTRVLDLDLDSIVPCVAGPRRPQDRLDVPLLKEEFNELLFKTPADGGYGVSGDERDRTVHLRDYAAAAARNNGHAGGAPQLGDTGEAQWSESEMVTNRPVTPAEVPEPTASQQEDDPKLGHGSVVIAAITSCTNTSNPDVMVAAGLVAKKAVEKGLSVCPSVKTSLAPGSRVVTEYLDKCGLQPYLDRLGFALVGYGCTTCIGNSGPLDPEIEEAISEGDLVVASVLSGNRNFEARIHSSVKANFLMSPPLVVAFALAGRVDINLDTEPLGTASDGAPVYLKDLWPTQEEIAGQVAAGIRPEMFVEKYSDIPDANPKWKEIEAPEGKLYEWKEESTYIQHPPYFAGFSTEPGKVEPIHGMRPLALLGDSVTTDHISPAGAISETTPAGRYLRDKGVEKREFNSYGARRGNDRVMTRGTFANVRIRNHLAEGREGGFTKLMPEGEVMPIFDACDRYREREEPLIVFGGSDYGMGSSRDWAAKGTRLLGVRAVVATSFERIHRSNLIGMGVLPLEFCEGQSWQSLEIQGDETFDLPDLDSDLKPRQDLTLEIHRSNGKVDRISLRCRIDTAIEVDYYRHGGILSYVLRRILSESA